MVVVNWDSVILDWFCFQPLLLDHLIWSQDAVEFLLLSLSFEVLVNLFHVKHAIC